MLSRHSVGTYLGNELTRSLLEDARPQSSLLAEPLYTDPWPERVDLVRTSSYPLYHIKKRRRD